MIIEKFLQFLDKNIHKVRISNFLKKQLIKTVIDVGAHKGEFIESILKVSTVTEIIGFEPQKKIFNILLKKFCNKNIVSLNNIALSEKAGKKIMKINKLSDTSTLNDLDQNSLFFKFKSYLLHEKNSIISEEAVSTTTIDAFFKNKQLGKNILLKIDTEGYEFNVLLGAKKTIQRIKYVLIENQFSKMYKNVNFEECHKFLTQHKFKLIKKFKFPTFHYEDRFYINTNVVINE
jgi:FkbM family methyltransferase